MCPLLMLTYKDGSAARGVVGTDSATIALSGSGRGGADSSRRAKLQGVVLGCTASYDGQSFQSSDGVLSLGNSNISFASRAAARFGGRFSYCLVDHLAPRNATSYLTFGPAPEASASAAPEQTPLLLDRRMSPFYAVTVDTIYVAGEALDIPAAVWDVDRDGGAILDSGTSLTILATPAYAALVAALSKQFAGLPRVAMDPFEYCYNWTEGEAPEIPALEVHFAGAARLEPPAKSYVIDAAPGVKCIGVQEGAWPGVSVIGNILQQEHLWEFDLRDRWLRFKHTRCAQDIYDVREGNKGPTPKKDQEMAIRGNLLVLSIVLAAASAKSARLDLVPAVPGASLAERARDDQHRHAYISAQLASSRRGGSRRRVAAEEAPTSGVSLPVSSGAYAGTGQYFVKLLVGTPAQEFTLVADTSSDLTWLKCAGAGAAGSSPSGRAFWPGHSKSWAPIPCSSDTCKSDVPFSLANCSAPSSPCSYDYRSGPSYKEGSAGARGVVGTDSATIALPGGKTVHLQSVVLGCSSTHAGQSFQAADGVMSLGYSKISFASRAAAQFGGSFSYCLVDHLAPRGATGYLAFGPAGPPVRRGSPTTTAAQTTQLLLDPQLPFYGVKVEAIHVAGKALDIPGEVWDAKKNGGAILDSGTTLTVLAAPAYKAVVAALSAHLAGVPKVTFPPFEHCYNWTWTARRRGAPPEIPKLAVQFAGSARLEPSTKSYVIDVKPGVKCLGVQEGEWPGLSVIGNILQQEHLWEFDLKNRLVRFKQSTCTQ
nr:unnamed protein product [Digitaria exilis]